VPYLNSVARALVAYFCDVEVEDDKILKCCRGEKLMESILFSLQALLHTIFITE
jgi:hypothetical protein